MEANYFDTIKGLGTNECIKIAVEAVKYNQKIDKRTVHYKYVQMTAPELCRLCAETQQAYEEA